MPSGGRACGSEGELEPTQLPLWLAQLGVGYGASYGEISHETRRCRLPLQGWSRLSGKFPEAERGQGSQGQQRWG